MFLSLCSHPTLFVGIGMKNTGSSVAGWKKEILVENLPILCFPAFEWSTTWAESLPRIFAEWEKLSNVVILPNTVTPLGKERNVCLLIPSSSYFDLSIEVKYLQGMEERLRYPISARNSARLEKNRDRGISNYETSESVWYKLDNLVPTTTTFGWLDNLQPKTIGDLHQLKAQTQPTSTSSCIDFIATH